MKIGLIQTRGIGDLIIALPIANWYIERGHQIVWPIDSRFVQFMRQADDRIEFVPVEAAASGEPSLNYFYAQPVEYVKERGCQMAFVLYSYLTGITVASPRLANSLKFDEYKYAIAGVPFSEKWKLRISRNLVREMALHRQLNLNRPYICVHRTGSDFETEVGLHPDWLRDYQIVEMGPITDNPFDWIYTLEHASKLVMIDSAFSNLVEGLNIAVEKILIVRSDCRFTPVFKNGWLMR